MVQSMTKQDALRILKRMQKPCPSCEEESEYYLIIENKNDNGVMRSKKFMYCKICGYKKEYVEKRDYIKFQFDEE